MKVSVTDLGKKYGKNWIFRNVSFEVEPKTRFAIEGKNGAGKSTLLQLISGFLTPSEGSILYNGNKLEDNLSTTFIGPYTEIIEEFTLREFLSFHSDFKRGTISIEEMADRASLPLDKSISDFSTGMKQRAKLITAFFFENEVIFLDEPTANLDQEGFNWWKKEVETMSCTVMVASNQLNELEICSDRIKL